MSPRGDSRPGCLAEQSSAAFPFRKPSKREFTGYSCIRNTPATRPNYLHTIDCSSNRESLRTVSGGSGLSFLL
jgi:hypothetical protein